MKKKICLYLAVLLTAFCTGIPAGAQQPLPAEEGAVLTLSQGAVFERRIPLHEIRARLSGGTDYLDKYGVTREKVVAELSTHEKDGYYLNTPFVGGDWQSPRGDTSYNGAAGTNCAGFVAYVLRKCGLDTKAVFQTMRKSPYFTTWGSGRVYDGLSSASNYMDLAEQGNLVAYAYSSKAAMLAGGKCEKGDIILRFWTDQFDGTDQDNHLMIFWGSTPKDDKVWQNASGRLHIGPMWDGDDSSFIVIKFGPEKPSVPIVAGFHDVFVTDWYGAAVSYVKEKGILSGTSKSTFSPTMSVTRGQAAVILWRLAGQPESIGSQVFSDLDPEQYYAPAVNWAAGKILFGYDNGTFAPDRPLTRQEFGAILHRYQTLFGGDTPAAAPGSLEGFHDTAEIEPYALAPMEWAVSSGLFTGDNGGNLTPKAPVTRAQAAQILTRLLKKEQKPSDSATWK